MSTRYPRRQVPLWALFLAVLGLVAGACSDNGSTARPAGTTSSNPSSTSTSVADQPDNEVPRDTRPWPGDDWSEVDPEQAGVDPAVLNNLATQAGEGNSDCLVVTRDGEIVGEWYWNGTGPESEREAFSVTKSITSTLVGIAQDQGHLDIDQPASDFITEWVGTPSESVTIRNLLSNDSGRFQTTESDYSQLAIHEADKTAYAIGLEQQHEIGTRWVYNNAAIQVLEEVLQRATGMEMGDYARTELFEPLGMKSSIITDEAGNTLAFMGAQMSCRDMARFGLLFLRGGEWNGEQIVSTEWVEEATSPSTELNAGYGYLWWLTGESSEAQPTAPGQEALPASESEAFAAIGLGGQVIAVVPEHDLVVTRLGEPALDAFSLLSALDAAQHDLIVE